MGLPSGLLWASCNVGAEEASNFGLYFSWGNVDGHREGEGYDFSQSVYETTPAAGINTDLSLDQDAARVNLGAPWRMPTSAEFQELIDNCTIIWTSLNGVSGDLFVSNINAKRLFFPAAGDYIDTSLSGRGIHGYYLSSSYYSASGARRMMFDSSNVDLDGNSSRRFGFTVRAVFQPT